MIGYSCPFNLPRMGFQHLVASERGDGAAFATGINSHGQVVGSTFNSAGWAHGFIWQDGVMTDLNSLISKDSNLFIVAASNIDERGQISGMAAVMSGPDAGKIHAILLTPIEGRIDVSLADFTRTHPRSISANAGHHSAPKFIPGKLER